MSQPLARIPSVDSLLKTDEAAQMIAAYGRGAVTQGIRVSIERLRAAWQAESGTAGVQADGHDRTRTGADPVDVVSDLMADTAQYLFNRFQPSLTPVINLTGIVIHTNLGRAPYPSEAIEAMSQIAAGNSNLEYDLASGRRGQRDSHVVRWLCELTGAQDALVVNNNAAAVMLCLNTLALNRKVLVSRGELIEIGGSFRMPEIMRQSGSRLKEVGTTNRTHLADFEGAITAKTAAIMKVHTSNYEVVGFTREVAAADLAALANQHRLPFIDDLGSGNLVDLNALGLPPERTVRQALDDGASLVTFSGDKLLGGPQCGVVAGRKDLIQRLNKNPMKRALRLDKVTLSALEAVLRLYAVPETLTDKLPVLKMLTRPQADIKDTATAIMDAFNRVLGKTYTATVEQCDSQIGSGSLPTKTLESWAVVCRPCVDDKGRRVYDGANVDTLAQRLRHSARPVIGRISDGALWLDCRTLFDTTPVTIAIEDMAVDLVQNNQAVRER